MVDPVDVLLPLQSYYHRSSDTQGLLDLESNLLERACCSSNRRSEFSSVLDFTAQWTHKLAHDSTVASSLSWERGLCKEWTFGFSEPPILASEPLRDEQSRYLQDLLACMLTTNTSLSQIRELVIPSLFETTCFLVPGVMYQAHMLDSSESCWTMKLSGSFSQFKNRAASEGRHWSSEVKHADEFESLRFHHYRLQKTEANGRGLELRALEERDTSCVLLVFCFSRRSRASALLQQTTVSVVCGLLAAITLTVSVPRLQLGSTGECAGCFPPPPCLQFAAKFVSLTPAVLTGLLGMQVGLLCFLYGFRRRLASSRAAHSLATTLAFLLFRCAVVVFRVAPHLAVRLDDFPLAYMHVWAYSSLVYFATTMLVSRFSWNNRRCLLVACTFVLSFLVCMLDYLVPILLVCSPERFVLLWLKH